MNFEKLKLVKLEVLLELEKHVKAEIENRMDFSIAVGREGHFLDGDGKKRIFIVKRINRTTVSVAETGESVAPGKLWKVYKRGIKMNGIPKERPVIQRKVSVAENKPADYCDAW
ncbi:hypothetical protein [Acinetobacter brisouii]|uniref:hypothetical protein n=1 Tax=Acinetobacter brisouii TaxID=396323 RepID=UPI00124F0ABC|nr:hypothetical protein [Acinetobacter brisouii]